MQGSNQTHQLGNGTLGLTLQLFSGQPKSIARTLYALKHRRKGAHSPRNLA